MAEPLLSFGGITSGLDTKAIIDALLKVQGKPIELLQVKQANFTTLRKKYESLETKLDALRDRADDLRKAGGFLSFSAKSSSETVLAASASGDASPGTFQVTVSKLAAAEVSTSGGYADFDTTAVGNGTIGITVGGVAHSVSIASGTDTLEDVRDAINDAEIGVTATIVNEGSGATPHKLVITGDQTGAAQTIAFDLSGFTGSLAFTEQVAAQDSEIAVNGLTIHRATNSISDVVNGVTLDLKSTSATPVTVTTAADLGSIKDKLQKYVEAHNDLIGFVNAEIKVNQSTDKAGAFNGESTARNIKQRILAAYGSGGYPGGTLSTLTEIGVKLDKDGAISFDPAKFDEVADDSLDDVTRLLTTVGDKIDKPGFALTYVPDSLGYGDYAVAVTQLATKAGATAGATFAGGGPLSADETLTFTVGAKTVDVALLSGDTLAQAVGKINNKLAAADVDVSASDASGSLKFDAKEYGSALSFSVVSSVAAGAGSTGVGNAPLTGTGQDVAGTINGVALVGEGQTLSGATGSPYADLKIKYTGTTTTTASLTVGADGFFEKMKHILDDYLKPISGAVDARIDGLQDAIDDMGKRITSMQDRLEQYGDTLRQRFTALDALIGKLQAKQQFLATFSFPG